MCVSQWLCTAVSYLCTRPIDFLGAAKACQPAHLAAHQLPPFCITITTGQAEAIWQSRKKDYECPYFNPSPLRDCWLKCLFFSTFAHCMNFKRRGYICEQWKEKLKKKITLVHNIIFCWYHLPTEMFVLEPLLWSHKITNIKSSKYISKHGPGFLPFSFMAMVSRYRFWNLWSCLPFLIFSNFGLINTSIWCSLTTLNKIPDDLTAWAKSL